MKRVMAGEYSRELSIKVWVGQCRGAALGFWQGGPPGYGMRRQLIDESGNPKGKLEDGQRKSLQTDRVILVPGPQSEAKIIRSIFDSFVIQKKTRTQIAAGLNDNTIYNAGGRPWTMQTIDDILTNEKLPNGKPITPNHTPSSLRNGIELRITDEDRRSFSDFEMFADAHVKNTIHETMLNE